MCRAYGASEFMAPHIPSATRWANPCRTSGARESFGSLLFSLRRRMKRTQGEQDGPLDCGLLQRSGRLADALRGYSPGSCLRDADYVQHHE